MKHIFTFLFLFCTFILFGAPEGFYDWNQAKKLHDGILHAYIYPQEPRPMKINTVRIDLQADGIDFCATSKDKDFGKPMPDYPQMNIETKRMKVKDFLLEHRKNGSDMLIAVNSTPWGPWKMPFNHKYGGNIKLLISDGVTVSDKKVNVPAFTVTKDNKVEIRTVSKDESRENFRIAMAGFSIILKNKQVVIKYKDYHPRTCYGISDDGRYLYLMTVDGRQKRISEGASVVECAEFMRYFGAADAINMDGGGSTTLVNWNASEQKAEILSHQAFGGQRSVATSLGIIKKNK